MNHRAGAAAGERIGDVSVPVAVLADQGDEEVARAQRAGVDRDAARREVAGDPAAGGRRHRLGRPERGHRTPSSRRITLASSKGSTSAPIVCPCSCPLPATASTSPGPRPSSPAAIAFARSPISVAQGQLARTAARIAAGFSRRGLSSVTIATVREPRDGLAHQRALAGVAVAAGAEHHVQPSSGVRPQCRQQPFEGVRRVGVVDIGRRPVRQRRRELHPPAHAGEARQQRQRIGRAQRLRQRRREQRVVGLEPPRQVHHHLPPPVARRDVQHLSVRKRHGAQQPHRLAALADKAEREPASPGDLPQRGERFHLRPGDHRRRRADRQQLAEQPELGRPVRGHRAVIIEMVPRQVGEAGGGEPHALQPELVEPVRRGLHRRPLDPGRLERRQRLGEHDRVGGGEARPGREARCIQPERAEAGRASAAERPDLAQELDRAGLAVGAGDRDHRLGLRAGMGRGEMGEQPARLDRLDQRSPRHPLRPARALRRQHRGGPARHRVGDEGAAVGAKAGQGGEQEAGPDAPAVGGQAGECGLVADGPDRGRGRGGGHPVRASRAACHCAAAGAAATGSRALTSWRSDR